MASSRALTMHSSFATDQVVTFCYILHSAIR